MSALVMPISKSRLFKQYLRWLPVKIGVMNKAAFQLQINHILPDDIFVVSYPKSGNTWVRYILAYLISGSKWSLTSFEVDQLIPDVYVSKDLIDRVKSNRFIKTHDPLFSYYPKSIYIYRDYRDVLVSYFHYKKALGEYQGDFSSFIRSNEMNHPFGSWKEHVTKALDFKLNHPNSMLLLQYESLKNNFENVLLQIAQFCGIEDYNAELIKEKTSFRQVRTMEDKYGSQFKNHSGMNFFRTGEEGSWRAEFTKEDLDFIFSDTALASLMQRLNYNLVG